MSLKNNLQDLVDATEELKRVLDKLDYVNMEIKYVLGNKLNSNNNASVSKLRTNSNASRQDNKKPSARTPTRLTTIQDE